MADFESLTDLMEDELKDLFNAENQLIKALPKLAKKASSKRLKSAFTSHLRETEGHVKRLETIGQEMGIKLTGKKCKAMEGLVEEGKEVLEEDGEPSLIDAALIGAAQRVEHYEIAAYGTARAMAQRLGQNKIVQLLQMTLDEEGEADKKLTEIAEEEVLVEAAEAGSNDGQD
jgi:ferritin-like metal-binding protein YciE